MSVELEGFTDVSLLGEGGFSRVYRARQRDFDRWVAVKVLDVGLDERQRAAFERECRAMGVVSQHPNIVTVLSAAYTTAGQPAIVMELYGGGTYAQQLQREGPLARAEVLAVGIRICGALQSAHDRGLLHRDVKPQNLFVSDYGEPALGDFGISSFADDDTRSGGLTVHYAAPEVIEHQQAGPPADVYALAATLYTLLAGRRPFAVPGQRQPVSEVALRILRDPPPPIGGSCPPGLERAILQGMAKRPEDRPASAASFGRLLQATQEGLGPSRTELAVARAADDDRTLARDGVTGGAAGSVDAPLEDESATVARPRRPATPDAEPVENEALAEPTPRRRGIRSMVVAAAALLALGAGLVWATGGPGEVELPAATDPQDEPAPPPDDVVVVRVDPPDDVTVTRDGDEVAVRWTATEGLRYQVARVDGDEQPVVTSDDGQVMLPDIGPDERPCVIVRSVSEAGQLSAPTAPVCSDG